MCLGAKVVDVLLFFLKKLRFYSTNSKGFPGGLVIRRNSSTNAISTHVILVGIILEGKWKALGEVYNFVNLDGPYGDKKAYWDIIMDQLFIFCDNCIVSGGDLNLTLNARRLGEGLLGFTLSQTISLTSCKILIWLMRNL